MAAANRTSRKSASTLDAQQGNEQELRAQVGDLTKQLAEANAKAKGFQAAHILAEETIAALAAKVIAAEAATAEKERKLSTAYQLLRSANGKLEAAGLKEPRELSAADQALAAQRAKMAAAKAEAMATGTSVVVK